MRIEKVLQLWQPGSVMLQGVHVKLDRNNVRSTSHHLCAAARGYLLLSHMFIFITNLAL